MAAKKDPTATPDPQLRAPTGQRSRISLGKPHRLHLPRLAPDPSSVVGQVYMTESRPILSITSISPHPSPSTTVTMAVERLGSILKHLSPGSPLNTM